MHQVYKRTTNAIFGPLGTLVVSLVFIAIVFAPEFLGRLEGDHYPVVTRITVEANQIAPKVTEINGAMFIERPKCVFDHIEWYLVTPGRTAQADVIFKNGTVARPGGWSDFGPWDINMDLRQLMDSSLAKVYHKCPGRPWLTETHFYPAITIKEPT